MRIVIRQHQKERFFTNYFVFLLLVIPDIAPVSGNNDTNKGTFPKRRYRKELVNALMRNFLLNTSHCNKNQKRQRRASKAVYICGFYPSKLGLHPEMLPSLA